MLKSDAKKGGYFSVSYETTIGGERYRPVMCYRLKAVLEKPVADLAGKGLAKIYPEEVRFVSGVAYPVKQPEAAAAPVVSVPDKTGKRRSARGGSGHAAREF
jgi:hypothetical protein